MKSNLMNEFVAAIIFIPIMGFGVRFYEDYQMQKRAIAAETAVISEFRKVIAKETKQLEWMQKKNTKKD